MQQGHRPFWDVTQFRLAVSYRRFGKTVGPETSITTKSTVRNSPKSQDRYRSMK